ncbi:hypothetical protein MB02_11935 [Croceicoccus estronivorus]|nr:hypothetical protein MB02_11935 [Croceicoccus estronivorus]
MIFAREATGLNLARELERCGAKTVLGSAGNPACCPLETMEAGMAAISEAERELGRVDAMVYAWVDPAMAERQPLAAMSEAEWAAKCELPLRYARNFFKLAHAVLHEGGGDVVQLLPSLAMTGSDGLLPWAAAAEGQRSLGKAAARAWGRYPIRINTLAVQATLLAGLDPDVELERPGLPMTSLNAASSEMAPVAALLATLLTPGFSSVTGTTIGGDGGRWMTP